MSEEYGAVESRCGVSLGDAQGEYPYDMPDTADADSVRVAYREETAAGERCGVSLFGPADHDYGQ